MKRILAIALSMVTLMLLLGACSSNTGLVGRWQEKENGAIIYDLHSDGKYEEILLGTKSPTGDYTFENGVLTLSPPSPGAKQSFVVKLNGGEFSYDKDGVTYTFVRQ